MYRYNTYNPYQGGGMQIPQIQQSQGLDESNIMELFKQFFQMSQMKPQDQQAFVEEFQSLEQEQQEQIVSYIQEQLSGGQQGLINESQQSVQSETLAPEQAIPSEQDMGMGMMQTGGYGNGFIRDNSGYNPMQLQMSPLGVLPMQYDQEMQEMGGIGGRKSMYSDGGFYRYQTAGITPMDQPMIDNSDAYQFDEYTQNPSIPISQSQVPESFPQQQLVPSFSHGEGSVLPSGDQYYKTAKASEVNKASAKRVVDLTDKDKQTLVDAGSKVKAMQRAIEETTGVRTGKLAGKYDGITGSKTVDGLRKLAATQGITKDKDIRDFALTNFGVEVPHGYLTGMAIKHNYDGAVKDNQGTKNEEGRYSKFLNYQDKIIKDNSKIDKSQLLPSQIARLNVEKNRNSQESQFDATFGNKVKMLNNSYFTDYKNYVATEKEVKTLNLSGKPNASNNWKATDSNKKLKEVGNNVYYHPDLKKILLRNPTGSYSPASENIIQQVLASSKNRSIIESKYQMGGLSDDIDKRIDYDIIPRSGNTKDGHIILGSNKAKTTFVYDPKTERLLSTDGYNQGYQEVYDYDTQVKMRAIMEKRKIKSPVVTKKGVPVKNL